MICPGCFLVVCFYTTTSACGHLLLFFSLMMELFLLEVFFGLALMVKSSAATLQVPSFVESRGVWDIYNAEFQLGYVPLGLGPLCCNHLQNDHQTSIANFASPFDSKCAALKLPPTPDPSRHACLLLQGPPHPQPLPSHQAVRLHTSWYSCLFIQHFNSTSAVALVLIGIWLVVLNTISP